MYNYTNTALAILEKANLITHEAAVKLSEELSKKIHQHRYDDALSMVDEVFQEVDKFVSEPWLEDISYLQKRVDNIETILAKLTNEKTTKTASNIKNVKITKK